MGSAHDLPYHGMHMCILDCRIIRINLHQHLPWVMDRPVNHNCQRKSSGSQSVLNQLCRPIVQSLCLIIYCSAPMLLLAVVVLFFNMVIRSFIINFILAVGATVFTLRCSDSYFRSLVPGDKSLLSLYPVLLFYTFMSIIIAMT